MTDHSSARRRLRRTLGSVRSAAIERARHALPAARLDVEGHEFTVPRGHPLLRYSPSQPRRNQNLRLIARLLSSHETAGSIVDVGANIGDTAAVMSAGAPGWDLILIEPSDEYRSLLCSNVVDLPVRRIEASFVAGGPKLRGELVHVDGTARVDRDRSTTETPAKLLRDVADEDTRLIKLDTDGFDHDIIVGSAAWLSDARPLVVYEDEVVSMDQERSASDARRSLTEAGYRRFTIWDDAGYLLAVGVDSDGLARAEAWLRDRRREQRSPGVYNFDVLAVHDDDLWIIQALDSARSCAS